MTIETWTQSDHSHMAIDISNILGETVYTSDSVWYDKVIIDAQVYLQNSSSNTGTCYLKIYDPYSTAIHTLWSLDMSGISSTTPTLTTSSTTVATFAMEPGYSIGFSATADMEIGIALTQEFDTDKTCFIKILTNSPNTGRDLAFVVKTNTDIPVGTSATRLPPPPIILGGL